FVQKNLRQRQCNCTWNPCRLAKDSIDYELGCRAPEQSCSSEAAGSEREPRIRPATANQIRAIHAIANRQNLDLAGELRARFAVERPEELTLDQASQLIDAIKPSANGALSQR
ncbi:MAG: hypothetical protein WD738_06735, partial [Pirellulales bacterium]